MQAEQHQFLRIHLRRHQQNRLDTAQHSHQWIQGVIAWQMEGTEGTIDIFADTDNHVSDVIAWYMESTTNLQGVRADTLTFWLSAAPYCGAEKSPFWRQRTLRTRTLKTLRTLRTLNKSNNHQWTNWLYLIPALMEQRNTHTMIMGCVYHQWKTMIMVKMKRENLSLV